VTRRRRRCRRREEEVVWAVPEPGLRAYRTGSPTVETFSVK